MSIFRVRCLALLLTICDVCLSSILLSVDPNVIPIQPPGLITLELTLDPGTTAVVIEHTAPGGSSTTHTADAAQLAAVDGTSRFTVKIPTISTGGLGRLAVAGTADLFPLRYYSAPAFSPQVIGKMLTTTGFQTLFLPLAAGAGLPSASARVLAVCHSALVTSPALLTDISSLRDLTTGDALFTYTAQARLVTAGGTTALEFASAGVPPSCAYQCIYVSYNNGYHWHFTSLQLPVLKVDPITLVSLYPYNIAVSPWVAAHNEARILLESEFTTAVQAHTYYEESWRQPALPSGNLVDITYFNTSISVDKASLIICAGTQYNSTVFKFVDSHPHVNFLLLSTLRRVLPARPNLAFATGRMYEAMWYAGFVAAGTSASGKLGFLMSLNDPGSYAFVNAYILGAQAAFEAGLSASGVKPVVYSYIIGAFSDDWAEKHAAIDLLEKYKVDILFPVTDNRSPQLECHKRGCYSLGFNADERYTGFGENILISTVFKLAPVYLEFISRMVNGKPFGPDTYDGGLGVGVDVSRMSSFVPLAVQAEVVRRLAFSKLRDDLEEIFCGNLITAGVNGAAGVRLLDKISGVVHAGLRTSVRGEGNVYCLDRADVYSMSFPGTGEKWMLDGVVHLGIFVPPPVPNGPSIHEWNLQVNAPGTYRTLWFCGLAILILSLASAAFVLIFRNHDVVTSSSSLFLAIICVGSVISSGEFIVAALFSSFGALSSNVCASLLWFRCLGFILIFGVLFAKTYRVHKIFSNKKLRRLRLNVWYVVRLVAILFSLEMGLLLVLTQVIKYKVGTISVTDSLGDRSIFETCETLRAEDSNPSTIVLSLHLILLAWGAYFAFTIRNVPLGNNESFYIVLSMFIAIMCKAVALIFDALGRGVDGNYVATPYAQYTLIIVRSGICNLATIVLVFGPKVSRVLSEWWRAIDSTAHPIYWVEWFRCLRYQSQVAPLMMKMPPGQSSMGSHGRKRALGYDMLAGSAHRSGAIIRQGELESSSSGQLVRNRSDHRLNYAQREVVDSSLPRGHSHSTLTPYPNVVAATVLQGNMYSIQHVTDILTDEQMQSVVEGAELDDSDCIASAAPGTSMDGARFFREHGRIGRGNPSVSMGQYPSQTLPQTQLTSKLATSSVGAKRRQASFLNATPTIPDIQGSTDESGAVPEGEETPASGGDTRQAGALEGGNDARTQRSGIGQQQLPVQFVNVPKRRSKGLPLPAVDTGVSFDGSTDETEEEIDSDGSPSSSPYETSVSGLPDAKFSLRREVAAQTQSGLARIPE